MKNYFTLQYKRINRHLIELGVIPWVAYLLSILLFAGLSKFFFFKFEWAQFVYPFFALGFIYNIGSMERNDFLKNCFSKTEFRKLRFLENSLIAIPFCFYQFYEGLFLFALLTFVLATVLSFVNMAKQSSVVIPTPFFKNPFEFIVGFRKTYWLIFGLYLLTYISLTVSNFNLGVFALMVIFLVCMVYYAFMEPTFYVWVFSSTTKVFLWSKIKIALTYSFMLSLQICIALIVYYPDKWVLTLTLVSIGLCYVLFSLVAKYAYYPSEISILPGLAIAGSLFFPPLMLVTIPFFYFKSINNLILYK